ncbi:MAG: cupin domain-containing protein [Actinobacteria bacterium]|nr:cupin domain-containing protein [Actinomycetota bacterium]
MSDGYQILSLDEIEPVSHLGSNLLPVRHTLDLLALGVNAWRGDTGEQLIPPHEEDSGSEELYVVVRGRATFTVGEEETDAPAGALAFVPSQVHRTAVAAEPGTIVLAVGATVGEPFRSGAWDTFAVADAHRRAGRADEGRAVLRRAMDERPDAWALVYNTACWEALDGDADAAFAHLRKALEMNESETREYMSQDTDLESLRADPRWEELAR